MLKLACLKQQCDYNALIHGEEQILNMSKREEVIPRYKFVSPLYYWKEYEDEKFEEKTHNFEPQIHYLVEYEAIT